MQITLLTWNIWGGRRLPLVIDFLKKNPADVIGLQEVWEIEKDGEVVNHAAKIAEALNLAYMFSPAFAFQKGGYTQGNAILSRFPLKATLSHLLSEVALYQNNAETEPRSAAEAVLALPEGGELRVLNTHLAYSHGLRPSKIRDMQMAHLVTLLDRPRTVLLGDFNVLPQSPEIKKLNEILKNADPVPIAPSWKRFRLASRLDHIFISRDLKETSCAIGASKGSDHLPVIATIDA